MDDPNRGPLLMKLPSWLWAGAGLLLGFPGQADVFWRQPADLPQGWTRAYAAPVRVQEGKGDMQVFATADRIEQIGEQLRREHGESLAWMPGENVAWALALEKGWLHRYLVQPRPPGEGGFWVIALRQRVSEAGKPGKAPTAHQLKDLPVFPQSTPTFFSLDEGNQLALEVSSTSAEPNAVLEQLSQSMTAQGWQASPANTGGFRLFVRKDRVAAISASRAEDGFTRVLRLHKPLGVE